MEKLTVRDWFVLVGLITGILYGVIAQASDFVFGGELRILLRGRDSLVLQDGLGPSLSLCR